MHMAALSPGCKGTRRACACHLIRPQKRKGPRDPSSEPLVPPPRGERPARAIKAIGCRGAPAGGDPRSPEASHLWRSKGVQRALTAPAHHASEASRQSLSPVSSSPKSASPHRPLRHSHSPWKAAASVACYMHFVLAFFRLPFFCRTGPSNHHTPALRASCVAARCFYRPLALL